jgi:transposase
MRKSRTKFTQEFKNDAVKLYLNTDKSQAEVSEELGISANSLNNWIKAHKKKKEKESYGEETLEQKVRRLEKENEILKKERDILKKSLGIVSKP